MRGRKRIWAAAALLGLALLASGCDWSITRGDLGRTGFNGSETGSGAISASNAGSLHLVASTPVPGIKTDRVQTSPSTGYGKLWLTGNDNALHVLDATGHQITQMALPHTDLGYQPPSPPTIEDGMVLVGTPQYLYAFDAKSYWPEPWSPILVTNESLGGTITGLSNRSPLYVSSLNAIVVMADFGNIKMYSAADGHLMDDFTSTDILTAPPAISGNWLYYGTYGGVVYARDLTRANPGWSTTVTVPNGYSGSCPQVKAIASVTAVDNKVIVSSCANVVQAYAGRTGTRLWTAHASNGDVLHPVGIASAAYSRVYFGTANGHLQEVDENSGLQIANINAAGAAGGAISIANGLLFLSPVLIVADASSLQVYYASGPQLSSDASNGGISEAVVANGQVIGVSGNAVCIWGL
jgi:outer membrane protein assembly factor BamB